MLKSKANSVFLEKWSTLAMNLNLPYSKIKKWRKDLLHDKIEDIQPLLLEIIEEWKTLNPLTAKLSILTKALCDAGLNDMANEIKIAFEETDDNQQEESKNPTLPTGESTVTKEAPENKPIPEMISSEELDFIKTKPHLMYK